MPNVSHALIARINSSHRAAISGAKQALQNAIKAGNGLLEAKAGLKHGKWEDWVEQFCDFSLRTAQQYIKVADNSKNLNTGVSIRHALADLAESIPESEKVAGSKAQHAAPTKPVSTTTYERTKESDFPSSHAENDSDEDEKPVEVKATIVDRTPRKAPLPPTENLAEPFAEFVEQWETIKASLRSISEEMRKWLDCNATARKPANPWAYFITYDASVGAVNSIIRGIDDNVPGAASEEKPYFLPVRSVKARESMRKVG